MVSPGAGCVTRPRRVASAATGAARSVRLSRSPARRRRWRRARCAAIPNPTAWRLHDSERRPPPFRAQPEGRARNLGEAGSAQPRRGEHWTVGAPHPSLSAPAPSLHDGVRRGHPSVLAAFGRCAPPTSPCTIVQSRARPSGCATRFVTPEGVRMGEVVDHQLSLSRFEEW